MVSIDEIVTEVVIEADSRQRESSGAGGGEAVAELDEDALVDLVRQIIGADESRRARTEVER